MTEKQKFLEWYGAERANGLLHIDVFPGKIGPGTTEEDIYRSLNEINASIKDPERHVERGDIF